MCSHELARTCTNFNVFVVCLNVFCELYIEIVFLSAFDAFCVALELARHIVSFYASKNFVLIANNLVEVINCCLRTWCTNSLHNLIEMEAWSEALAVLRSDCAHGLIEVVRTVSCSFVQYHGNVLPQCSAICSTVLSIRQHSPLYSTMRYPTTLCSLLRSAAHSTAHPLHRTMQSTRNTMQSTPQCTLFYHRGVLTLLAKISRLLRVRAAARRATPSPSSSSSSSPSATARRATARCATARCAMARRATPSPSCPRVRVCV